MTEKNLRLPVFVHNLSYEFEFLLSVLDLSNTAEIFATDKREILFFRRNAMEFRCSYRLSNDNLYHWSHELKVDHPKQSAIDYDLVRYPWSQLSDMEIKYCVHDVIGLVECIYKMQALHHDNMYDMPYTSTGYVRRLIKKSTYWVKDNIQHQINDLEIYKKLRLAYRGGNTHTSNAMTGIILDDVYSYDRSSSYPDVMIHCKYPKSRFRPEQPSLETAAKCLNQGRCLLLKVEFNNIECNDDNVCPYISFAQCDIPGDAPSGAKCDNGRILRADRIVMYMTHIDLDIIMSTYHTKGYDSIDGDGIKILELYSAAYGYLPNEIRQVIIDLYKKKTALKHSDPMEYMKAKALLNALYGMMTQRAIQETAYIDLNNPKIWDYKPLDELTEYEKYRKKTFLNYAWGLFVCAHARAKLQYGINMAGAKHFVYCDTDSIKADCELDFSEFNAKCVSDALKSGAYAQDTKGVTHYMGVYEFEYKAARFKSIGAKRYIVLNENNDIEITIAGVHKKKGVIELKYQSVIQNKSIMEIFADGMTFTNSGHIAAYYNDLVDKWVMIDGHKLHITSNVCLVDTPYTMKITDDYAEIMDLALQKWIENNNVSARSATFVC